MNRFLLIVLSWSTVAFALDPPPKGKYVFIKPFELTGCVKFEGGRGIVAHCLEFSTKTFKPGDTIQANEFFWDDHTNTFGVKTIHADQFRSIPMQYLKFVAPK